MEASGIRIIKYGRKYAEISLYDVADIHWLNRGISKPHLHKDHKKISEDPYAFYFCGGDYGDWIFPGDPRFDPESYDPSIRVNDLTDLGSLIAQAMLKLFSPISNKCLGFLIGNHEQKAISRQSMRNFHTSLCNNLSVPNMRFSGFTDLYFCYDKKVGDRAIMSKTSIPPEGFNARLRTFVHHGMGAANTAGGKINKLKQLVDMVDADLVMMSHVHEQFAKSFLRLTPNQDCSEIGQRITMGLITGSYLRTYAQGFTGYGEPKGYLPTTLGATRARYIPESLVCTVENKGDGVGLRGTG